MDGRCDWTIELQKIKLPTTGQNYPVGMARLMTASRYALSGPRESNWITLEIQGNRLLFVKKFDYDL
ncbi:Chromosome segregation ATPase [Giardia duodenalis]|uniref:Chromosome segregation ATPase n=1 Tax=Giardia intestinalis TaxID=5741 RepID=V6TLI4_GIAIN|nr:Chromosome segregation ATPase [Giardia intestinalis]